MLSISFLVDSFCFLSESISRHIGESQEVLLLLSFFTLVAINANRRNQSQNHKSAPACRRKPVRDPQQLAARPELRLIHNGHRSFRDTDCMAQLIQLIQLKRINLHPIPLASSLRCCLVLFRSGTPDCCAGC